MVPSCLSCAATWSLFLIHFTKFILSRVDSKWDSMWVGLSESAMTEYCQLVAAGGTRTQVPWTLRLHPDHSVTRSVLFSSGLWWKYLSRMSEERKVLSVVKEWWSAEAGDGCVVAAPQGSGCCQRALDRLLTHVLSCSPHLPQGAVHRVLRREWLSLSPSHKECHLQRHLRRPLLQAATHQAAAGSAHL